MFRYAERLAASAAISTESASAMLLWLGSVCMLRHTTVRWPTGIWYPSGLTIATVEDDGVPIDSITNEFIRIARRLGVDPISDTVKEGPAGLIARLESTGRGARHQGDAPRVRLDSISDVAAFDTSNIADADRENLGNVRALIYPSGRAILSYLYDTPFFNALDELIQHGNLHIRGKHDTHQLNRVNMSLFTGFYQGALVNLTTDNRVQNNMLSLLRQMLVFWPTSGTRRFTRPGNIGAMLGVIEQTAMDGIESLAEISTGSIAIPELSPACSKPYIDSGVGTRYTVLNRDQRIVRLALAIAFWRIADGGSFEVTRSDLAMADATLHLHEMGGRLLELALSKGRQGHEFMRMFLGLLDSDSTQAGAELAMATEMDAGAKAANRLNELSVTDSEGKLAPQYRMVQGTTVTAHKKRWGL